MRLIVRTQKDSPVRRFAQMVKSIYEFPVIIAVVSPNEPKVWGLYKLNNLLSRWAGTQQQAGTWVERLFSPFLVWLGTREPGRRVKRIHPALSWGETNHAYIHLLWKAAQKNPIGRKIPPPQKPSNSFQPLK
ncbi:MAG: hypothetical protein EP343_08265 [Deltaproteobacteria bacterium]|nr:MAG: hypothetical protein EP343_08265 [Deltaproteobacteria bacterium]